MTIVCLGWGSLIWMPGALPSRGLWHEDGPKLPLEFARRSMDGRITLVISDGARRVRTLWTELEVPNLEAAADALAAREKTRRRWIGAWSSQDGAADERSGTVGAWAAARGFAGVVWTALPPKWQDEDGRAPSEGEAVAYLQSLPPDELALAREYIHRAPDQIRTSYRPALTAALEALDH